MQEWKFSLDVKEEKERIGRLVSKIGSVGIVETRFDEATTALKHAKSSSWVTWLEDGRVI